MKSAMFVYKQINHRKPRRLSAASLQRTVKTRQIRSKVGIGQKQFMNYPKNENGGVYILILRSILIFSDLLNEYYGLK